MALVYGCTGELVEPKANPKVITGLLQECRMTSRAAPVVAPDTQLLDGVWTFGYRDHNAPYGGEGGDYWDPFVPDESGCDGEEGGGGDGWGNLPPPSAEVWVCYPESQAACTKPLNSTQKAQLDSALNRFAKNPATIADTMVRRICSQLLNKVRYDLTPQSTHPIWVGVLPNLQGEVNHTAYFHGADPLNPGALYTAWVHIDKFVFDSAGSSGANRDAWTWELAAASLHETAHALGYPQHNAANEPVPWRMYGCTRPLPIPS
ncbi:MAG: hypothetical protein HUU26_02805 [Gemmatimonadaceae bacterium]|nr:hypothetical protein [Gemmatimonadaceae bacterium]